MDNTTIKIPKDILEQNKLNTTISKNSIKVSENNNILKTNTISNKIKIIEQPATIISKHVQGPPGPMGPAGQGYGWIQYADTEYTEQSPLLLEADVRTILPNNAGSNITNYIEGDYTTHNFIVNNQFIPLDIGGHHILRISFKARSFTTNNVVKLELDIGGTQGVIYADKELFELDVNDTTLFVFTIPLYTLNTFLQNKGTFYVTSKFQSEIFDIVTLVFPESV